MNSMLSDSIIALILSSLLLIIVLLVNPILVLEDSFVEFKRVKELEVEIKDLFKLGYLGRLANYLELNSPKLRTCLGEIYAKVHSKGVVGLRLLTNNEVVYSCGSTDRGWIIRIIIPSSKHVYVLEFFVYGDKM